VQQDRLACDPWQDVIESQLALLPMDKTNNGLYSVGIDDNGDREWRVASAYLLGSMVLAIPAQHQTAANTRRLADVMRALGWAKPPKIIRVGTKPCRGFTKPIDKALPAPIPKPALEAPAKSNGERKSNEVVLIKRKVLGLRPL
jgi:hypothetical protein